MAEEETTENKPKGGGKKLLIIGLLAGLIVGGGGGYGAFMMLGGAEKAEAPKPVVVEKKPKSDPYFIKIEKMNIPLVHNNRVMANIVMDFSMEVDGNDNKMLVVRNLPEIRDAMLRYYSVNPVGKKDNPRNVDYPELKKTLKRISNEVLHKNLIKRVMVVQMRQY